MRSLRRAAMGLESVRSGLRNDTTHESEHSRVHFPHCVCALVREARCPRLGRGNEGNRAFDFAERPQCECEVKHCGDADVVPEAKSEIVVPTRPEQGKRAFQMIARFFVFTGEPVRHSGCAMRYAGGRWPSACRQADMFAGVG